MPPTSTPVLRRLAGVVVVVLMVTVPVPLVAELESTMGVVEAEQVGSTVAPVGDAVKAQPSVTEPA